MKKMMIGFGILVFFLSFTFEGYGQIQNDLERLQIDQEKLQESLQQIQASALEFQKLEGLGEKLARLQMPSLNFAGNYPIDLESLQFSVTGHGISAAEEQEEDAKAYQQAYNLILDEKWQTAQKAFQNLIQKYPNSKWVDDSHFWYCYTVEKLENNLEKVFKCYQDFVENYRRSRWANDAKASMIRIGQQLVKSGKPQYEALVKSMQQSDNEEVFLSALYALQNIGDERSLQAAIDLYENSAGNERIREKITYILANFDSPKVVSKLVEIAKTDPSSSVRKKAVYALGNHEGTEAITALKQIIRSDIESDVRKSALYALSNHDVADIVPFFGEIARTESDESVAKAATYAIGNNDNEAVVMPELERILKEAKLADVRKAALHTIGNQDGRASLDILRDVALHDPDLGKTAVYAIANNDDAETITVLINIFNSATDNDIKKAALYSIGNNEESQKARNFLMDVAISHSNTSLAKTAVYALANWSDDNPQVMMDVLQKAKSIDVKKAALYSLEDIDNGKTIQLLGKIIKEEKDPDLRQVAVRSLGQTENNAAIPILLDVIKNDSHIKVRKTAVSALGEIGTPEAQAALMKIISGKND